MSPKGRVLIEHIAHHPLLVFKAKHLEFLDEELITLYGKDLNMWSLYFDGAINFRGREVWTILLSQEESPSLSPIRVHSL